MKNNLFNLISKTGIPYLLRRAKGQSVTVLCFHRISEERDFFFDPINPAVFDLLLKYCIKNYAITTFSDLNTITKKPKLILSFDDGYYDFMEHAIPILSKYNLPCNHNLVNTCLSNNQVIWTQKLNDIFNYLKKNNITDDKIIAETGNTFQYNWNAYYASYFQQLLKMKFQERTSVLETLITKYNIQSQHRMMNWDDAKLCMDKYRVEIGCHTYYHDSLFTLHKNEELELEIGASINEMENKLKTRIYILALPNGNYNDAVLDYIVNRKIKYTLLLDDKVTSEKNLNGNFNLISRINMGNQSVAELILRTELFHSKIKEII